MLVDLVELLFRGKPWCLLGFFAYLTGAGTGWLGAGGVASKKIPVGCPTEKNRVPSATQSFRCHQENLAKYGLFVQLNWNFDITFESLTNKKLSLIDTDMPLLTGPVD